MSNHHSRKAINLHHNQEDRAKERKESRRQARCEALQATREAIKLNVTYWKMAITGFTLSWFTAVSVIAITGLVLVFND